MGVTVLDLVFADVDGYYGNYTTPKVFIAISSYRKKEL